MERNPLCKKSHYTRNQIGYIQLTNAKGLGGAKQKMILRKVLNLLNGSLRRNHDCLSMCILSQVSTAQVFAIHDAHYCLITE
jgi:hypothetical protein